MITLEDKTLRYIKRKGFTHIKVELEANLGRPTYYSEPEGDRCPDCYYGSRDCEHDNDCPDCSDGDVCGVSGLPYNTCEPEEHDPGEQDDSCFRQNCETCHGQGYTDCGEDHTCTTCDGDGNLPADGSRPQPMTDDYCKTLILNRISPEAREALTFSKFYRDGSVDSEYTFTIPIEKARLLPEFLVAFKSLSEDTGKLEVGKAGMHMALMTSGDYSGGRVQGPALDPDKLTNFKTEMVKLMPALFFLGSADHRSRELGYRRPIISDTKYSAIHVIYGGFEYRVFQTCYDKPEMILQFVQVIAKTLKFYGTTTIKKPMFRKFDFYECQDRSKAYVSRFFQTPEAIEALDKGLEYLKPDGTTADLLKAQRYFRPKFSGMTDEVKLRKRYIEYASKIKERNEIELRDKARYMLPANNLPSDLLRIYDIKLKKDELKKRRNEWRANQSSPLSFQNWLDRYGHEVRQEPMFTIQLPA